MKYTTAVLGQDESCGTSIAEESKILLVLFRALKGGKTWFLAREIRLCGLDYRSDVAFFAGILLSRCWCIAKGGVRVYLGLDFDSIIQFTGVGFIAQLSPGVF